MCLSAMCETGEDVRSKVLKTRTKTFCYITLQTQKKNIELLLISIFIKALIFNVITAVHINYIQLK